MKKSPLTQSLWIISTLNTCGDMTTQDFIEKWEAEFTGKEKPLTDQKLWRWIKDINTAFAQYGIKIESGRGCHASHHLVVDNSDPDTQQMRDMYINMISRVSGNDHTNLEHRISLEFPKKTKFLRIILNSMEQNKVIEITYLPTKADAPHTYSIIPYYVCTVKEHVYIVGKKITSDKLLSWALDRFQLVQILSYTYKLDENIPSAKEYLATCPGIVNDKEVQNIEIKAYGSVAKTISYTPLETSQKEIPHETNDESGSKRFQFQTQPNLEMKGTLLYKGEFVEVMKPLSFRQEMAKAALRMTYLYRNTLREMFGGSNRNIQEITENEEYINDLEKYHEIRRIFSGNDKVQERLLRYFYMFTEKDKIKQFYMLNNLCSGIRPTLE